MGHLTKWLFFNLLFGAMPYTLVVALNQLHSPGSPLLHPSSEVLFIAVVATSSALGELWDQDEYAPPPQRRSRSRWQLTLLLGVLFSSLLYGAFVYATLMSPGRAHGIDCSVVASWDMHPVAQDPWRATVTVKWRAICAPWVHTQALFFRVSLWMTLAWAMISTVAMVRHPPKRR